MIDLIDLVCKLEGNDKHIPFKQRIHTVFQYPVEDLILTQRIMPGILSVFI